MAAPIHLCILGDSIGLGKGCPKGKSFADRIAPVLEPHGVEVINWSREEQTATGWALEQLDDLRVMIGDHTCRCSQVVVVIELGSMDRVFLEDMLLQSLTVLVKDIRDQAAIPILMQVVPDDCDPLVASQCDVPLVPAPPKLVKQFKEEPCSPFVPHPDTHKDMAKALVQILEQELKLPLGMPAGDPGRKKGKSSSSSSNPVALEGVWMHKDEPQITETIQGDTILSADGSMTRIQMSGPHSFFIVQDGARIDASVIGHELRWSDGDIWCLVEDTQNAAPTLSRPPERKKKDGDLRSLKKAWDAAEEAVNRTRVEEGKRELEKESDRVAHERNRLEQQRRKIEEGQRNLHKETEQLSAMAVG